MINSTAWQLYGGANDDLLQQGLCHMLHDPGLLQSEPLPPQRPWRTHASTGDTRTLKSRFGTVSVGSLGPGAHKIWFEPSEHLWQILGLILNMVSPLLPSCWGVSFARGYGVSFFGGIEHSPVNGCLTVRCNFGVLTGDECTSFYSAILVFQGDTCSLEEKL